MFEILFTMSLAGAAALAVWWVLRRLAGNRFNARWQYRTLKLALVFFLVPIGPCLKALRRVLVTAPTAPVTPVLPDAAPVLPTAPVLPVTPQPILPSPTHRLQVV